MTASIYDDNPAITPYVNTIAPGDQPHYPGDLELERRIKSLIRWNAMAMVVRANRRFPGLGGHISTFASCATLFEVAFMHMLRATDLVYLQGHASPGVYARAFLQGRLERSDLDKFRRELAGGLPSYPHPRLMPTFWQFPTVSMGLGPLCAIYQARFLRYAQARDLAETSERRVWCFLGDGECDEPEALAALALAGREHLDNLVFVVSCNLQRLDGPVRGNHKIIQELEGVFAGAGWRVIKVLWGSGWDSLLEEDSDGLLVDRMNETVDGDYQRYSTAPGSVIRDEFFGASDELRALVDHLSDEQLRKLGRGGHDPLKVYAAYDAAVHTEGRPVVVLAKTVKGYGLGEAGEGRNVTHQQKKLNDEELRAFRSRFGVPIGDEDVTDAPFYRPSPDSDERRYLRERTQALGGPLPARSEVSEPPSVPDLDDSAFATLLRGSGDRDATTTMAYVRVLGRLLRDDRIGERVVPIIPDEARTFGMEPLFREHGIYTAAGQRYVPVDQDTLLRYREAVDGQILEEGITEAGAMGSFIAAGTAYANVGVDLLPMFAFYSMYGFQRVGDVIWAAGDTMARGFLFGGTAGRTTLNGEGLQHQDGNSQLLATTVPNIAAYDPAYAYELAVIVQDGLRRMLAEQQDALYYVTLYNEPYTMPSLPERSVDGIRRGMYLLRAGADDPRRAPQLLASGPLVPEALRAQELLRDELGIAADVWSVTSYQQLRADAIACERHNRFDPDNWRESYLDRLLDGRAGPYVAVSDWVRLVPDQIARFVPGPFVSLGTDGWGRSDTRAALRRHFEIDAENIALACVGALIDRGDLAADRASEAARRLELTSR